MAGGVIVQSLADGTAFDGQVGSGLFSFQNYNALPLDTRVALNVVAYTEETNIGAVATNVQFWFEHPTIPSRRITVGEGEAANGLVDVNGLGRLRLCGLVVPRDPGFQGNFWNLTCYTQGKINTASVMVDVMTVDIEGKA